MYSERASRGTGKGVRGLSRAGWSSVGRRLAVSPLSAAVVGIAAIGIGLSIDMPQFLSVANGVAISYYVAIVAMLAVGETLVILTAGVDLSSGPVLGVAGMAGASVTFYGHWPAALGILVCLATGIVAGSINGVLVVYVGLNPFIATLGVGSVATGLTLVLSEGGNTLAPLPGALTWLGSAEIGSLPVLILVVIAMYAVGELGLRRSVTGRDLYAIGGNARAARLAGVRVRTRLMLVYAIAGLTYAVAGLGQIGVLDAATSSAGQDDILAPIAAAVIGGVSLFGGRGSLVGSLLGVVLIGVIEDGMAVLNVPSSYTPVVYGAVVVLAVGISALQERTLAAERA